MLDHFSTSGAQNQVGPLGSYTFSPLETGLPGNTSTGFAAASFLLGQVDSGTWGQEAWQTALMRPKAVYAQDKWKLRPNLTLTLGLRWEYEAPTTDKENRLSTFLPNLPNPGAGNLLGALVFAGTGPGRAGVSQWAKNYYLGLGPRIHLGECCVFGLISTEEELIRRMDENGVDATIVQPYPGAKEAARTHDRVAKLCGKYPGRFFGLASVSPHGDHDAYRCEVERCVKDLGFVGVKLHTIGHGVNPLSEDGDFVFATAHDLGIAAMVHTGPGVPFALPSLCIPAAQRYPGLKIIFAHAGFGVFSAEGQVAASISGNLYLETSWCIGEDIRWMISTIGPDRVMMGADLPSNVPVEIAKYRALDLEREVYDKVMGGTAIDVFKLVPRGSHVCVAH